MTLYLSISLVIILFFITLLLHIYNCKILLRESTTMQRCINALFDLRLVLSITVIYYIHLSMAQITIDNIPSLIVNSYIYTIVVTLDSVFIALFWFFILIVAYGWQIHRRVFTRNEISKLILIFVGLYLIICIDPIIDYTFKIEVLRVIILFKRLF